MNSFQLNRSALHHYEAFSRSFATVEAADLRDAVEAAYANGRFTPAPLVSMNPRYRKGSSVGELVRHGALHPDTGRIFRIDGAPIRLHEHQDVAVGKACEGHSFVVTTGTGSGKSLCFFVPIVDRIVRARAAGEERRTRAIVIYPMNALANSQLEEIGKFLGQSGLADPPTVGRYTGQEGDAERRRLAENPPDILLTNFVMLELLLTRHRTDDAAVIANCQGLEFLVLDELHTYRGRQGADVAMLMRRLREALGTGEDRPICIGTSATMASGDEIDEESVPAVASMLFATTIDPSNVIGEWLELATEAAWDRASLAAAVREGATQAPDEALSKNPLVAWAEKRIGLDDRQGLARRPPITIDEAAASLADDCGVDRDRCREALEQTMLDVSLPEKLRGGTGERAFLAFKVHQFVSGPENIYATLARPPERLITLDAQQFHPEEPASRLFETHFCRTCGQEYHPVRIERGAQETFLPRSIDDAPADESDEVGFLMTEPTDLDFGGAPEDYPETWTETIADGSLRLVSSRRARAPRRVTVLRDGKVGPEDSDGLPAWYTPGKFSLCLRCKDTPSPQGRDKNRLSGLSAEGRSSATTAIGTAMLTELMDPARGVPDDKQKLLAFTDNRQDAALQAGHFNDTVFVAKLRAGMLAAMRTAGDEGLEDEELGRRIAEALGYKRTNDALKAEWLATPSAEGGPLRNAEKTLWRVLSHRAWADQRRGWRYTNPNLEELGLLRAAYIGADELAEDGEKFRDAPSALGQATPDVRLKVLNALLDHMRRGLAVDTEALDRASLDGLTSRSRGELCAPWSFGAEERVREARHLVVEAVGKASLKRGDEDLVLRAGSRSALGRQLNRREIWGERLRV